MTLTFHDPRLRLVDGRAAPGAWAGATATPSIRKTAAGGPRFWSSGARPAGVTRVLVDTSPDLREQLLDADVDWLDGVLFTHPHADHTHGIDDLRPLFVKNRRRLDAYLDEPTSRALMARFGYCFEKPPGSDYPPILTEHRIEAGQQPDDCRGGWSGRGAADPAAARRHPLARLPVRQPRLFLRPERHPAGERGGAWQAWTSGSSTRCATRRIPAISSLADALGWIERVKPRRAILTNLHSDLDYEVLRGKLPPHVEPAFDGLRITSSEN